MTTPFTNPFGINLQGTTPSAIGQVAQQVVPQVGNLLPNIPGIGTANIPNPVNPQLFGGIPPTQLVNAPTTTTRYRGVNPPSTGLSSGAIAGIAIAAIIAAFLIIFLPIWFTQHPSEQPEIVNTSNYETTYSDGDGVVQLVVFPNLGFHIDKLDSVLTVNGKEYKSGPQENRICKGQSSIGTCGYNYPGLQGELAPGTPVSFLVTATDNAKGTQKLTLTAQVPSVNAVSSSVPPSSLPQRGKIVYHR